MSELPDAAIEAAAEAWEAHYEGPAICGSIDECSEHAARAGIEAAMPAIREHIAQEIEEACPDQHCRVADAARIVRGGTP